MTMADTHFIFNQSRCVSSVLIGIRHYNTTEHKHNHLKCKPSETSDIVKYSCDFLNSKVRDDMK